MKKIFFIHEDTRPIKIGEYFKQIPTNYGVVGGYIMTDEDIDIDDDSDCSYEPVYAHPDRTCELENFFKNVFFDTFEEGQKTLTRFLSQRCHNDINIHTKFDILQNKYPEYTI